MLQTTLKKKNPVMRSHEKSKELAGSMEGEEYIVLVLAPEEILFDELKNSGA
jgi:hypothetical protein